MNKPTIAVLLSILASLPLHAGSDRQVEINTTTDAEKVPLDIFETENAYIFESDLNHGGSFGQQDELQNDFYYAHRFHITGNWYARAGVAYDRFDFGRTDAPVPLHLQSGAAVLSIDYMHGEDIGAMLEVRPGIYTENNIGLNSFDCPITLMRFWVVQQDKFYILTGVNYAFLRGGRGVLPVVGFVWVPNKHLHIQAVPPEPKIIYSVNKQLDLYLGGELEGGSFRTDHHDEFSGIPHVAKLSGTQVDFVDYRVGGGIVWSPVDQLDIDMGGGYSIEHAFLFHRAGENYRSDPAPFVRLQIKAHF